MYDLAETFFTAFHSSVYQVATDLEKKVFKCPFIASRWRQIIEDCKKFPLLFVWRVKVKFIQLGGEPHSSFTVHYLNNFNFEILHLIIQWKIIAAINTWALSLMDRCMTRWLKHFHSSDVDAWCPQNKCCTDDGRTNKSREAVFYEACSSST